MKKEVAKMCGIQIPARENETKERKTDTKIADVNMFLPNIRLQKAKEY